MKIGIFGGTFSPPHLGHIRAAEAFANEMELDKLIIIPTFIPHKKDIRGVAPALERLHMCRLSFEGRIYEISDMEIARGDSYTAITLDELKKIYPDGELYILFGTDMFLTLGNWVRAGDIFGMCTVVCASRENDPDSEMKIMEKIGIYREQFGARIRHISLKPTEISSSDIRDRIKLGEDISGMVTPSVRDYIKTNGLYK